MATLPTASRNAVGDALVDLVDAGTGATEGSMAILDGASDLVVIGLGDPAFGATGASNAGEAELTASSPSAVATASGTADGYEMRDKDDNVVWSGSAGTVGTELILTSATIATSDTVVITSGTLTVPAS